MDTIKKLFEIADHNIPRIDATMDYDRMLDDISNKIDVPIFEDSYGGGVALIGGTSYATYSELAESFNMEVSDYIVPPKL